MSEQLIDRIYESAVLPERWVDVLDNLSRRFRAKGGILFTSSLNDIRWLSAPESQQVCSDWFAQGWAEHNDRVPRLLDMKYPGFVTDLDLYTQAEIAARPMYSEFLFPRGYIAAGGTAIQGATGDMLIFSLEGFSSEADARASIPFLDSLRPHIARSAILSSQLHLERARAAVAALDLIGTAAAFISEGGKLVAANSRFVPLLDKQIFFHSGGVRLPDSKADALLKKALHRARVERKGRSIPIPAEDAREGSILHVVPICGDARDVFASGGAILVMARRSGSGPISQELLQGLFDLTPAEARLARSLMQGFTLEEAARAHGVSESTVRTQLKGLFAKTGESRQADLVRLLASFVTISS